MRKLSKPVEEKKKKGCFVKKIKTAKWINICAKLEFTVLNVGTGLPDGP